MKQCNARNMVRTTSKNIVKLSYGVNKRHNMKIFLPLERFQPHLLLPHCDTISNKTMSCLLTHTNIL